MRCKAKVIAQEEGTNSRMVVYYYDTQTHLRMMYLHSNLATTLDLRVSIPTRIVWEGINNGVNRNVSSPCGMYPYVPTLQGSFGTKIASSPGLPFEFFCGVSRLPLLDWVGGVGWAPFRAAIALLCIVILYYDPCRQQPVCTSLHRYQHLDSLALSLCWWLPPISFALSLSRSLLRRSSVTVECVVEGGSTVAYPYEAR